MDAKDIYLEEKRSLWIKKLGKILKGQHRRTNIQAIILIHVCIHIYLLDKNVTSKIKVPEILVQSDIVNQDTL